MGESLPSYEYTSRRFGSALGVADSIGGWVVDEPGRAPFGRLLRQLRLARGLSQEALAERATLSVDAISTLERGSRKVPQRQTLALLIEALELDVENRARLEAAATRPTPLTLVTATTMPAAPARRHNLNRPLTRFVGREGERRELRRLIADGRVVTVAGIGGVGKTRVALELGFELLERYGDGVWVVELANVSDARLVAQEVAAALEIPEQADRPLLDIIVAGLRARSLLLVLDNCEHVVEEAARVTAEIAARCPYVDVLATSREPLHVDGEVVYRLPPLTVPDEGAPVGPDDALRFGAVELFIERAAAHDPRFQLTERNGAAVATICSRLDGIPLALELAAATIPALGVAQVAARLDERLRLLTAGRRNVPRQRTLRALMDWSFELLTHDEATVFCRLGVLAGSWTLEAAIPVCGGGAIDAKDVPELLVSLVEKSLVVAEADDDGEGRFHLLESARTYALSRLDELGERAEVGARHVAMELAFAHRARTTSRQLPEDVWLAQVEREIEHVRAALTWTLGERADVASGAQIAALLGPFWDARRFQEGAYWLGLARAASDGLSPQLASRVLLESVRVHLFSDETLSLAERALAGFRDVADATGTYETLAYRAQALINLGRYGDAREALHEGIALARAAFDAIAAGRMLALLGFVHLYTGELSQALERFAEADEVTARTKRDRDAALVLRGFAEAALWVDDAPRAVDLSQRSLALTERLRDARRIATAHYRLAHALLAEGRIAEARVHVTRAIADLLEAQNPIAFLEAIIVAAAVHVRAGDDLRAARLLGFAQARAGALPFRSVFLIPRLRDRTRAELIERLGGTDFDRLASIGALFDEEQAAEEADGR
ncbi:MAG TPA: helix-turn-helix domain-containing protein [Candidatus Sulfotelmatobacter sp.]|nr:helix-turn-helix domain-containing protein [Candidatus Sulfotelmatobacter sp.]